MRFHFAPFQRQRGQTTLSVVLIYGIFTALWILFSDKAVEAVFQDPDQIIRISMIKGWLFVAVTTGLLYVLVRHQIAQLNAAYRREIEMLQEKQRSLDLLAAIADNSDDVIFAKDPQGRYLLFNNAACRIVGKPAAAVLGHDDSTLFPAEQAGKLMANCRRVIATGQTECNEEALDTSDGKRFFLTTLGPLRDADHRVIGLFGISRDITARNRAAEELRESEERFRALVEQSAAGIYIAQDNRFRYVNPYFARLAGYDSPQELMDQVSFIDLIAPEQRPMIAEKMKRRMMGDASDNHYHLTGIRRDGSRIEVELHANIIQLDGRPALIGLFIDTTPRFAAEKELRARNEELERFNQAMIGRELDMVELKQQINELSKELGREPPFDLAFLDSTSDNDKGNTEQVLIGVNDFIVMLSDVEVFTQGQER